MQTRIGGVRLRKDADSERKIDFSGWNVVNRLEANCKVRNHLQARFYSKCASRTKNNPTTEPKSIFPRNRQATQKLIFSL
ncbi:hypothetical protein ABM34_09350 [Companilactobacillus ginsenosidimutans]|uniref:Uncharacterized protein n=1 Tax=Companilactobacillus ginsenosidimutans TaxID=1007676 RepID=A0A0H4R1U8_9LACO|nr:hypothetical protein ABM34_09350 [Companilactobacillus ginsenosidimutans]